ncbi:MULTISPECIES: hypothetical protein [Stenotrophomonas]|uniref:hypothetical protein n=1 Tax=Stenotrophomonas TaxID=40323 RepID=UPI0018D2E63E|nr:hypothetical protein [Stenotrophomonas sp.]MBH1507221.1 hypothetical protein [Stenotrophomonas maltophilia]
MPVITALAFSALKRRNWSLSTRATRPILKRFPWDIHGYGSSLRDSNLNANGEAHTDYFSGRHIIRSL